MDISFFVHAIIILLICGLCICAIRTIPGLPGPIVGAATVIVILGFILWLSDHIHLFG